MQSNGGFEFGAMCLGDVGATASWRREKKEFASAGRRFYPTLVVQTCGETGDGMHKPAESVTIIGADSLLALRAAIDEALKYHATSET